MASDVRMGGIRLKQIKPSSRYVIAFIEQQTPSDDSDMIPPVESTGPTANPIGKSLENLRKTSEFRRNRVLLSIRKSIKYTFVGARGQEVLLFNRRLYLSTIGPHVRVGVEGVLYSDARTFLATCRLKIGWLSTWWWVLGTCWKSGGGTRWRDALQLLDTSLF